MAGERLLTSHESQTLLRFISFAVAVVVNFVAELARTSPHKRILVVAIKFGRLTVFVFVEITIPIDKIIVWIRIFRHGSSRHLKRSWGFSNARRHTKKSA